MQHNVHHIVDDPVGDIVISVGMGGRLVRAHRNVLIMSSPVLKTLLAPGYSALSNSNTYFGSTRNYTANNPLLLPADDPDAFIDFCTILHQQAVGPKEIPLQRLPAVAVLADKYGCAERLRPVLAAPFHCFFANLEVELKTLEAVGVCPVATMCTAYATGDAKLFARTTRWLLVHMSHRELVYLTQHTFTDALPSLLLQHMAAISENALDKLDHAACHEPVRDVFTQTPYKKPCDTGIERIGSLTFHMCKVKRGERTFHETLMSLGEAWEAVSSVGEIIGPGPEFDCSDTMDDCSTGACLLDIKEILDDAVQRSMDAAQGLCLGCLKAESLAGLSSCKCAVEY